MHFTGAFATVVIRRIGLPDSAKPYGYMRLFLRPTVPRVCATAVCPGVRSSQNAPSLDPLSYPSDHSLRLRSIRRAAPFSVTLRLHCIFRRLPCACAHKRPQSLYRLRDALCINWPEPEPLRSRGLSGGAVPCWYVARTKYVLHVSYSWYGQLHCTRKGLRASLRSAAVTSRAYKKAQKQCVFCSQTKTLLKGVRLS